jgi:hypothetical protein
MAANVKTTAIPAAGYVYQTMQGVNLLCDWLDAPTRYTRVRFECDADEIAPQGLDDLVAERPDGKADLWQVKFTPAEEKHLLDWEWLLEKPGKKGGKSRSNLRKWFDALKELESNRVGHVRLLTNRIPDSILEVCLAGGSRIDYTKAPAEIQLQVIEELGGSSNAKELFDALDVRHSDKGFASIESHVTARLRRHSTPQGVEALKNRAIHWSIQKNQPAPDGWITLELLRATLLVEAPEPLPENFAIPPGYRVPDTAFFLSFINAIEAFPTEPIVLTGPPGRGKSTFLSKACELLQKKGIPLVRHHYYLSSTDRSHDRHTSFVVEESLLAQIQRFHPDVHVPDRALGSALAACAAHYKKRNKPFVLILDGLDHVWRNQGQDKRPLDEIFNQVLPPFDNLVVVVGTQPVEDAQLPSRLLASTPRSTWRELPVMSADAVLQYVRKQVEQGRLQIEHKRPYAEEEIQSAAAEVRARTNGHPLHVIYAIEELIRSGRPLSKWSVEQLLGDMSKDVKTYYASLWNLLPASQKDVLRLVCEFPFFWPTSGFTQIARIAGAPLPEVSAVMHLLYSSSAGLKPFHESLVVFIKQTDDYAPKVKALIPLVERWLSHEAPNSLRVNWLWSVKAKQGHPEDLIEGLQRDWIIDRLCEGYPTELFESLMADAEEHAVCRARYPDAYRLRHLKTRSLNSLSYQLTGIDAVRLKACTWTLARDSSVMEEAVASRHETTTLDVAALSRALATRGDYGTARKSATEALHRFRGESRFVDQRWSYESRAEELYLASTFVGLGVAGSTPERAAEIVMSSSLEIGKKVVGAYVDADNVSGLVQVASLLPQGEQKAMVCDAAVRAAALADAELVSWSNFQDLSCGLLAACMGAMKGKDILVFPGGSEVDWSQTQYADRQEALTQLARFWFFGAVHLHMTVAGGDFCFIKTPTFKDRENVSDYLEKLTVVAADVAKRWLAGESVSFLYVHRSFESIPVPDYSNYQRGEGAATFRRALIALAVDLHLLDSRISGNALITSKEVDEALRLSWFDADHFRSVYVSELVKVLTDDAAEFFILRQRDDRNATVEEETGARMRAFLDLCEMSLRHGLANLAGELCRVTWELALGYGQRKDPALPDVMDAISYLTSVAPDDARRLLYEISPQIEKVSVYTDGKGTRHVVAEANELLARLNREALAEKHRQHVELGQWDEAEKSLATYMATAEAISRTLAAVARTGMQDEAVRDLEDAAKLGNNNASQLRDLANEHTGRDVGTIAKPESGGTSTEFPPFEGDVSTYAVNELKRLQTDLAELYGVRREVLKQWYAHWESQGLGSDLIQNSEPMLLSADCRDNDLAGLLDAAFATKLRLEGPRAAFPYIVQAQRMNGGWLGPMYFESRKETESRLRIAATKYRSRGDEFFLKSAFGLYGPKPDRVIPTDIMVFFLGQLGRTGEAVAFAEAMVRSVQEDTRTLRLERPAWAEHLMNGASA